MMIAARRMTCGAAGRVQRAAEPLKPSGQQNEPGVGRTSTKATTSGGNGILKVLVGVLVRTRGRVRVIVTSHQW